MGGALLFFFAAAAASAGGVAPGRTRPGFGAVSGFHTTRLIAALPAPAIVLAPLALSVPPAFAASFTRPPGGLAFSAPAGTRLHREQERLRDTAARVAAALGERSAAVASRRAGDPFEAGSRASPAVVAANLAVADPEQATFVAEIVEAARASPTARKVLRRVARLAARRGYPVAVELGSTQFGAEIDCHSGVVRVSRWYADVSRSVSPLIHELLHVVQLSLPLPSMAFETELEAHMYELMIDMELGLRGRRSTVWDSKVIANFRKGPAHFIDWLFKTGYSDNVSLLHGDLDEHIQELQAEIASTLKRLARARKTLALRQTHLRRMRADGHPADAIRSYRGTEAEPAREKVRLTLAQLSLARHDLALLQDPHDSRFYRDYSRRMVRFVRETHRLYTRP